jgi:hypothetical protein
LDPEKRGSQMQGQVKVRQLPSDAIGPLRQLVGECGNTVAPLDIIIFHLMYFSVILSEANGSLWVNGEPTWLDRGNWRRDQSCIMEGWEQ